LSLSNEERHANVDPAMVFTWAQEPKVGSYGVTGIDFLRIRIHMLGIPI